MKASRTLHRLYHDVRRPDLVVKSHNPGPHSDRGSSVQLGDGGGGT